MQPMPREPAAPLRHLGPYLASQSGIAAQCVRAPMHSADVACLSTSPGEDQNGRTFRLGLFPHSRSHSAISPQPER